MTTLLKLITVVLFFACVHVQAITVKETTSATFGKVYLLDTTYRNFTEAQQTCAQHNSSLLTIDYKQEYDWLAEELLGPLDQYNAYFWLGATPVASKQKTPTSWLDGTRIEHQFYYRESFRTIGTGSSCNALQISKFRETTQYNVFTCDSESFTICQSTSIDRTVRDLAIANGRHMEQLITLTANVVHTVPNLASRLDHQLEQLKREMSNQRKHHKRL